MIVLMIISWKKDEVLRTRRKNARLSFPIYSATWTCPWAEKQRSPAEKMSGQRKGRLREGWANTDPSCERTPCI